MKKNIVIALVILGITSPLSAKTTKAKYELSVNPDILMHAIINRENPRRDPNVIGDKHMRNKAIGLFQIRKPYLESVKKIVGKKEIQHKWGKNLTVQDMKNTKKAKWVCQVYLSYYGKYYTKKTHKKPTFEVYARIHNGGPIGWKKKSTAKYGKAVMQYVKAHNKTSILGKWL